MCTEAFSLSRLPLERKHLSHLFTEIPSPGDNAFHKAGLKVQIPLDELILWCDSKLQVSYLCLPARAGRGDENTRKGKRAVNESTETIVSTYLFGPE